MFFEFFYYKALFYTSIKKFKKAKIEIEKCLEINNQNINILYLGLKINKELEIHNSVIEYCDMILKLKPNNYWLNLVKSISFLKLNNIDSSSKYFKEWENINNNKTSKNISDEFRILIKFFGDLDCLEKGFDLMSLDYEDKIKFEKIYNNEGYKKLDSTNTIALSELSQIIQENKFNFLSPFEFEFSEDFYNFFKKNYIFSYISNLEIEMDVKFKRSRSPILSCESYEDNYEPEWGIKKLDANGDLINAEGEIIDFYFSGLIKNDYGGEELLFLQDFFPLNVSEIFEYFELTDMDVIKNLSDKLFEDLKTLQLYNDSKRYYTIKEILNDCKLLDKNRYRIRFHRKYSSKTNNWQVEEITIGNFNY